MNVKELVEKTRPKTPGAVYYLYMGCIAWAVPVIDDNGDFLDQYRGIAFNSKGIKIFSSHANSDGEGRAKKDPGQCLQDGVFFITAYVGREDLLVRPWENTTHRIYGK